MVKHLAGRSRKASSSSPGTRRWQRGRWCFALSLSFLLCGCTGSGATAPSSAPPAPSPVLDTLAPSRPSTSPGGGPVELLWTSSTWALLNGPGDIVIADDGRILVREVQGHKITTLDAEGRINGSWGSAGTGEGQFDFLELGLADYEYTVGGMTISGDTVFVADENRVQAFDLDGTYRSSWSSRGRKPGQVLMPEALATGPDGNIYLVDAKLRNVQVFTPEGELVRRWPLRTRSKLPFPSLMCVNENGQVFIAEEERAGAPGRPTVHLHKYSAEGKLLARWGRGDDEDDRPDNGEFTGGTDGMVCSPDGTLYVGDSGAGRVQVFDDDGRFLFAVPGIEGTFALAQNDLVITASGDTGTVSALRLAPKQKA